MNRAKRQSVTLGTVKCRTDKCVAKKINLPYIDLNPFWQRTYECWQQNELTKLIETLLLDRAMNPIWLIIHPEEPIESVLDGMHRLTTCINFINGKFSITGKFLDELDSKKYNNKRFDDLDKKEQDLILNYSFEFNLLDDSYHTDFEKRSNMYNILNRVSYSLTDFEYNKNIYHEFYNLLETQKTNFETLFKNKKDTRGIREYELLKTYILATENDFILEQNWSSLNKLRESWESKNLKNSEETVNNFLEENADKLDTTFKLLKKIQTKFKQRNIFAKDKKKFNSDYIIYIFMIARSAYYFKNSITKYMKFIIPEFKKYLNHSDIVVEILGPDTKGGRNSVWQKGMIKKIDKIIKTVLNKTIDKKRYFSKADRVMKWKEQGKKCAICKEFQALENCQGDHIKEHSDGGKTTYENLQMLCIPCHEKKSGISATTRNDFWTVSSETTTEAQESADFF